MCWSLHIFNLAKSATLFKLTKAAGVTNAKNAASVIAIL